MSEENVKTEVQDAEPVAAVAAPVVDPVAQEPQVVTPETKPVTPQAQTPAENGKTPDRTFTQQELEYQIDQRLNRERAKYADYDTLKTEHAEAKAALDKIETAKMSELDQAQKRVVEAEAKAAKALQTSQDRLTRAEFTSEAALAGAAHPGDAYNLANQAGVKLDDAGNVTGVKEAVTDLVTAGRLVMQAKPTSPPVDGGKGGGERPVAPVQLTPEEEVQARKFGMTNEEYAKWRN